MKKKKFVLEHINHDPYTCPELGRTVVRTGAYDAFDLPSLYGDVRKPYRFSKEMRDLEKPNEPFTPPT